MSDVEANAASSSSQQHEVFDVEPNAASSSSQQYEEYRYSNTLKNAVFKDKMMSNFSTSEMKCVLFTERYYCNLFIQSSFFPCFEKK